MELERTLRAGKPLGCMTAAIPVTISVGITVVKEGDSCLNDIINRADEALYHAKNEGHDRVEVK